MLSVSIEDIHKIDTGHPIGSSDYMPINGEFVWLTVPDKDIPCNE